MLNRLYRAKASAATVISAVDFLCLGASHGSSFADYALPAPMVERIDHLHAATR